MHNAFRGAFLRAAGFVCLAALYSSQLYSQAGTGVAVPNRISPAANWAQRVPLRNHLPLWANSRNSTGPASGNMALDMVLSRSPEQQAALDQLLADQKNPASPEFHHWLTPLEFGRRFGLSLSDIEAVSQWLQAQGLHVTYVAPSRTFIGFSGPAAAVGHAFGTEIRSYRVRGEMRTSVSSEPSIPAALGSVVKAIRGLYTIDDRPQHVMTTPELSGPNMTLSAGVNYIVPGDFTNIYDGQVDASGYQQIIGIVGRSRTNPADFTNFAATLSVRLQTPTEIVPTAFGGVDPGPAYTSPPAQGVSLGEQSEATLDVTRAGSVAPDARLLLVVATQNSGGIGADAQYLIQTSPIPAQVINISYGACESAAGASGVNFWDTLFEQAAAEGISVFVSSGDSGASGCEQAFVTPELLPPGISPNYICSSSYATCVGGTEFNDTANPSQYWGANASNFVSALSYIPEGGWNDPTNSQGGMQIAGSGGGVSNVIPTPTWQTGPGVPAARAGRYTPDVSFNSSCHTPYFACLAAAGGSCVPDSHGQFYFIGFCGTSAAAPSMAGVAALLDEKMKLAQGNITPQIYAVAQSQPSAFHDTTPSSSGVATCDIHTPSMCNNSTPGPTSLTGGQAGYPLTTGYDEVTGVGSVDVAKFISSVAVALPQPTVTVTASPGTTVTPLDEVTFTVSVAGSSGQPTPTGIVELTSLEYDTPADVALVNGTATFVIPALSLSPSYPTFTATYTPDSGSAGVYDRATGTVDLTVNPVVPTVTMSGVPSTATTAQDVRVTVAVAGPSGAPAPGGSVTVSTAANGASTWGTKQTLSGGSPDFTIPAGVMPAGADLINASYTPDDQSYKVYTGNTSVADITVTQVPKTTPTVKVTASPTTATPGQPITLTVNVVPATGAPTPTGTVTFQNAYPITQVLSGGSAQIVTVNGQLPVGTDTVTINYSGDANSNAATGSATVTISKISPVIKATPASSSITSDQSLAVQIEVDTAPGVDAPTGAVTLASGSYTSAAVSVVNNVASITIPAGSLPAGTDTLTASYSGDLNYSAGTTTTTVTVTTVPPSFAVKGDDLTISAPGATTGNTSTVTITPANGFTGSVALTAAVTSSPAGAQNIPTLSFGATTPVSVNGTSAVTATLTVNTTAPSTSALASPAHRNWRPIGETALGLLILCGLPARRRRIGRWLGTFLLLGCIFTGIAACSGGSASTPPPVTIPGTTSGTYVVTVTATSGSLNATTTLKVTVN